MALHTDGGYYPAPDAGSAFDAILERAEATLQRSHAARLEAARKSGWTLVCPETGLGVAQPGEHYGDSLVREDGEQVQYAHTPEGHEVAGVGGCLLHGAWLPVSVPAERRDQEQVSAWFAHADMVRRAIAAGLISEDDILTAPKPSSGHARSNWACRNEWLRGAMESRAATQAADRAAEKKRAAQDAAHVKNSPFAALASLKGKK